MRNFPFQRRSGESLLRVITHLQNVCAFVGKIIFLVVRVIRYTARNEISSRLKPNSRWRGIGANGIRTVSPDRMIVPRENNTRRKTFGDGNQYLPLFEFYIIFEERPKRARKTKKRGRWEFLFRPCPSTKRSRFSPWKGLILQGQIK